MNDLPPKKSSGKSSGKSRGSNEFATNDGNVSFDDEITEIEKGWRLEKNSNGYYRWRWQLKHNDGAPVTYVNKSGKIAYKRGSKYVGKKED